MSSWQIVLIDTTAHSDVPAGQLQQIATALQQQVDDHFAPHWGVRADISAPAPGEVIPPDALRVNVVDAIDNAGGVHLDANGQPYAEAVFDPGPELSIAISHEVLEMLVDPWGNRFTPGPDVDPEFPGRQVFYLVEVGDPCETTNYPIGDVQVSDFILPSFYDPNQGAPYDYCDTLAGPPPQKVPAGCYISWIDPTDGKWHQQDTNGNIVTAVEIAAPGGNPREDRDEAFPDPDRHNIPAILKL